MRYSKAILTWVLVFLIINTIGATSEIMERARQGPEIALWKPFLWEYSSGFVVLVLIPLILKLDSRFPFRNSSWRIPGAVHLLATVPFSITHVAMMVGIRKAVYASLGENYDFGNLPVELLYEYRKDVLTYFLILGALYSWRRYRAQHSGAAYGEEPAELQFQVRNRGRSWRINAADIDWIESAGNYVLLHVGTATHPLRDTMKDIMARLGEPFYRLHRTIIVNLDRVDQTLPSPGGQLHVRLTDGTELKCSRTQRDGLQQQLENRSAVHP